MSIDTMVTISIVANSLILFIYSYLFYQYRQPYLKKWLAAWCIHTVKCFLDRYYYLGNVSSFGIDILIGNIIILFLWLIIAGTAEFAGKRLSKGWAAAAIICSIFSTMVRLYDYSAVVLMVPIVIYGGITYIATGLLIHKLECNEGASKNILAGIFILLGIHFLDFPLLFPIEWIAPYGVLLDSGLKVLAALILVFIYLEKTRSEYRLLAENGNDIIYRYQITPIQGFQYISPAAKRLTGYELSYYKDVRHVLKIVHPEDKAKFKHFIRRLYSGKLMIWRIIGAAGEVIWMEQKYSLVKDEKNNIMAVEGIVRDITSRVLLEQNVARLDRLNIAGQMAASFAHEIRNPLTAIKGYLTFIGGKRELSEHKSRFDLMIDEIDRANHIITEYLSLHKDKRVDLKQANINHIIETLQPLLALCANRAVVGQKLSVMSERLPELATTKQALPNPQYDQWAVELNLGVIPDLWVDEDEVKQVLLNLVRNALESMPNGGIVEVGTKLHGQHVVLSVKDEGDGIPLSMLDNIGKPFITTKERGSGLGLAICYRIAERHNAKIEIETGPKGTTMLLKIPLR